jgi:hypothetical protein
MTIEQITRNKIKIFRPTSQALNLYSPNLNDRSTRLFRFKDEQGNRFKVIVYEGSVELIISVATSLHFSINIPDLICLSNQYINNINDIGILFTDNSSNDQVQTCIKLLFEYLKLLQFDTDEGLTVYKNCICCNLNHSRKILPEIEVLKKIKELFEMHFPDSNDIKDYNDLPTDLKKILLKYESFVIADDLERDELASRITKRKRINFINAIFPYIEQINLFLDSFGDRPLSDGAIGLQSLAELSIELSYDNNI